MQTVPALERTVYELCLDMAKDNVRYAEIRFGPWLHVQRGLSLADIIRATLAGWKAGQKKTGIAGGIIVTALRDMPPAQNLSLAQVAGHFVGDGVIGFDLAGDEAGYPVLLHREPLLWARDAGYNMTIHAGEAAGAQSVRDAVEVIGAVRIGHGTRSGEDPSLVEELRIRRTMLELCPTSNVQSRAAAGYAQHPLPRYYLAGLNVSISTDNRTVSDTTMTRELTHSHDDMGLDLPDLAKITLMALDAGFANTGERESLRREYVEEMERLGLETS